MRYESSCSRPPGEGRGLCVSTGPAPARTYVQRNARTAVESLKTEMAWGPLEVRKGGSPGSASRSAGGCGS